VSLDRRTIWVDIWAFERLLATVNGSMDKWETTDRALQLYRGAFLPEDNEEPWTVSCRERLRAKFVRHSAELGRHFSESGELERALDCFLHGLEADDLAEELYQGVMRCYQHMQRRAEGLAVYRRMRQTLSVTLGIKPSPVSEAIYRSLSAE